MTRAVLIAAALAVSACRGHPEVPIFNFHAIGTGDEFAMAPERFAEQLDWLRREGYSTATLAELRLRRERGEPLGGKVVLLTFDDGTADAVATTLPLLRARGMRGTFFIVTGWVGKRGYMDWSDIAALARAGMEIGSHTVDHERLTGLPRDRLERELRESKAELERRVGLPIEALAYPYNAVSGAVEESARAAGYKVAVAGPVHGGREILRLERIPIRSTTTPVQLQVALRAR